MPFMPRGTLVVQCCTLSPLAPYDKDYTLIVSEYLDFSIFRESSVTLMPTNVKVEGRGEYRDQHSLEKRAKTHRTRAALFHNGRTRTGKSGAAAAPHSRHQK